MCIRLAELLALVVPTVVAVPAVRLFATRLQLMNGAPLLMLKYKFVYWHFFLSVLNENKSGKLWIYVCFDFPTQPFQILDLTVQGMVRNWIHELEILVVGVVVYFNPAGIVAAEFFEGYLVHSSPN